MLCSCLADQVLPCHDQYWPNEAIMGAAFITNDPGAPASLEAIGKIIEFVHREIP